jgi:hypothetical protein
VHDCTEPLQQDEDKIAIVLNEEVIVGDAMNTDEGPLQSYWLAYDGHNNIVGLYKEEVQYKVRFDYYGPQHTRPSYFFQLKSCGRYCQLTALSLCSYTFIIPTVSCN